MSVVLPKREIKEKVYPFDATAVNQIMGTAGNKSGYSQVVASTTNEFLLCGVHALSVFNAPGSSFSGAVPFQADISTGAAASEVVKAQVGGAAGIQFIDDVAATAAAQIGFASLYRTAPILIPASTRIAVRSVTSATVGLFIGFYVVGYEAVSGFSLPKPFPRDILAYESYLRGMRTDGQSVNTDGTWTSVTSAGTNWVFGTTVQLIAATTEDILIKGLVSNIVDGISLGTHAVVEIGVGSAGNEIWMSVCPLPGRTSMPGPGAGYCELLRPLYVKAGERVACRAKSSPNNKTWTVQLVYDNLK